MKTSAILALSGSLLAMASPINKRVYETEYVTDLIYVTVTVDPWTTTTVYPLEHETPEVKHTTLTTAAPVTIITTTRALPPPTTTSTTSIVAPPPTTSSTSTSTTLPLPVPTTSTTKSPLPVPTTSTSKIAVPAVTIAAEVTVAAKVTVAATPSTSSKTSTSSTSSTTAAAATASSDDFQTTAVYHHNIHRANHSAPDLSWNSDLASYAATVAATCVFAHDLTPGASTGAYGQNIAMYGSSDATESTSSSSVIAQAVTDMWYNGEVWQFPEAGYGEDTPDMTDFEAWGHFSQLVWVASTEVGCAVQYCAAGTLVSDMASFFSVCNYRSEGNVGGSYGTNVLKSLGKASVTI
ncbi:scp-like extracellular protein [Grosmannia clavigera kw1407]|uniref:Scp-like extracellular protein n=1 Tax=Grosmannia clavigera (strain kw1407 / UAMH 11150) TaxID=655863 RepID=F0XK94_GROCL|nr:scp-like extracellular protein [Grosmannia clavigera kw1407]EFX02006.1 scp-like extracellular protein [Grosmannia clavigera kw1407]